MAPRLKYSSGSALMWISTALVVSRALRDPCETHEPRTWGSWPKAPGSYSSRDLHKRAIFPLPTPARCGAASEKSSTFRSAIRRSIVSGLYCQPGRPFS